LFHRYLICGVLSEMKDTVTRTAATRESDKLPFPFWEVQMAHPEWSADKVRGGEIDLRQPWQKIVFFGWSIRCSGAASDR